jgi:hypothetical protein
MPQHYTGQQFMIDRNARLNKRLNEEKDMPGPAVILPWVALGLEALGGFFSELGKEEPEFHVFDPEIKDRYKELRGVRMQQQEIMRSSVAAVDGISHPTATPEEMWRRWGIKKDSPQSAGMLKAAQENVDKPDSGQMLADRIKRRDRAKEQAGAGGQIDKTRELIKRERMQG